MKKTVKDIEGKLNSNNQGNMEISQLKEENSRLKVENFKLLSERENRNLGDNDEFDRDN